MFIVLAQINIYGQKEKLPRFFDDPVCIDSTGVILIPTRYNTDHLSSNKIAFWNNYAANILIVENNNEKGIMLFEEDTYIKPFEKEESHHYYPPFRISDNKVSSSIGKEYVFYLVKNVDFDGNERIDEGDPLILYSTDLKGKKLNRLSPEHENVVSYHVYEKTQYLLIKLQRDINRDKAFNNRDKDFYFKMLSLSNLEEIKDIDLNH